MLRHPPYFPYLAYSDYHIFSTLQRRLDGQHFINRDDIEKLLELWLFSTRSATFWIKGIHDLPLRWQKTIDVLLCPNV